MPADGRSAAETAPPAVSRAIPLLVLAWLVPGAGHLFLRRSAKGLIFLGAIGALFVLGLAMDSRLAVTLTFDDVLASLFSLAQMALGGPYLLARALGLGADPEAVKAVTFEYGNTFTAVAGLLNILVVLDAWDTALGRKP